MDTDYLRTKLGFWASQDKGITTTESIARARGIFVCNNALEDCLLGKISFLDFLDICHIHGIDVDNYLDTLPFLLFDWVGVDINKLP